MRVHDGALSEACCTMAWQNVGHCCLQDCLIASLVPAAVSVHLGQHGQKRDLMPQLVAAAAVMLHMHRFGWRCRCYALRILDQPRPSLD